MKRMSSSPASNFFLMPNEIFSLGLSAGEIAVYAYLMFCEDRETYTCHPSYKTIGNALHISGNTVKKKEVISREGLENLHQGLEMRIGKLKSTSSKRAMCR